MLRVKLSRPRFCECISTCPITRLLALACRRSLGPFRTKSKFAYNTSVPDLSSSGGLMSRFIARAFVALLVLYSLVAQTFAQTGSIMGFADASAAAERAAESKFDSYLNAADLTAWQKRLSARPHHLGSAYDRDNAEFIASLYRSWGYDTQIETFDVLFPTPKTRIVEMTAPERYRMKLQEPPVPGDPTS